MYGLKQSGLLANQALQKHLLPYGFFPSRHTPGLWCHTTRPIAFTLVVDDFGIKYVGTHNAQFLLNALKTKYNITTDCTGSTYCGMTFEWQFSQQYVDISMPHYVVKALTTYQHDFPSKPQHAPSHWTPPKYGQTQQLTSPPDTSEPMTDENKKQLQKLIGTFLYYSRAVDPTMLLALGDLASAQNSGTQQTTKAFLINGS